jgi:hypothetical protein
MMGSELGGRWRLIIPKTLLVIWSKQLNVEAFEREVASLPAMAADQNSH